MQLLGVAYFTAKDLSSCQKHFPISDLSYPDIWDPLFPYRDMKQMLNSVDRIFEDFLPSRIFGEDLPGVSALTSTPRLSWDIRETDNEYELHADVPGVLNLRQCSCSTSTEKTKNMLNFLSRAEERRPQSSH